MKNAVFYLLLALIGASFYIWSHLPEHRQETPQETNHE
jgi:uncharacterized membrane protein